VDVVVTLLLDDGILSLAATMKAFSGSGPINLWMGTCSRSCQDNNYENTSQLNIQLEMQNK
jgi:hypothetical protein